MKYYGKSKSDKESLVRKRKCIEKNALLFQFLVLCVFDYLVRIARTSLYCLSLQRYYIKARVDERERGRQRSDFTTTYIHVVRMS